MELSISRKNQVNQVKATYPDPNLFNKQVR